MSETRLECLGLPCPQPVLRCKEAVEGQNPERIVVAVDNDAASENVSRFLGTRGYTVQTSRSGETRLVTGTRDGGAPASTPATASMQESVRAGSTPQRILVFISADAIGSGDSGLGGRLMVNFLSTLKEMGGDLWRIILVNGGVRLSVPGSACLESLQALEAAGVSVLVCGTCLEHFGLTNDRRVGQTTNMLDVVTSFQLATKTVHV